MGGLDHLAGRSYGPFTVDVSPDRVAAFVAAVGEDPDRWSGHAPPMFANVALFTAAPVFLEDPEVVPFTRSLIHSEQRYGWERALKAGDWLEVTGEVTSVRERRGLNLVAFEVTASCSEGPWLESRSSFVLSEEAAGEADEEEEPPALERSAWSDPTASSGLEDGDAVPTLARSASRSDLVRYAGATGDWNPIHWDHDAARGAGLAGVIVHGLLMGAWMATAASQLQAGVDPLRELSMRFRSPLRPARPAAITGDVKAADEDGRLLALTLESEGERLVTANARVTP